MSFLDILSYSVAICHFSLKCRKFLNEDVDKSVAPAAYAGVICFFVGILQPQAEQI